LVPLPLWRPPRIRPSGFSRVLLEARHGLAVGVWLALGLLLALFGPRALDEQNPLWLGIVRFTAINTITWTLITPSFVGLPRPESISTSKPPDCTRFSTASPCMRRPTRRG
jgi:hypothetical protein